MEIEEKQAPETQSVGEDQARQIARLLMSVPESDEEIALPGQEEDVEASQPEEAAAETAPEPEPEQQEEKESTEQLVARLSAKIEELSEKLSSRSERTADQSEQAEAAEEPAAPDAGRALEIKGIKLDKEAVREAMYDEEKMVALLEDLATKTQTGVLQQVPNIVAATVTRQNSLTNAVTKFYSDHPDLKEHANYVSYVSNQVQGQHPDWSLDKILHESAMRVYRDLGIKVEAKKTVETAQESKSQQKPAFARKPRSSGVRAGTAETLGEQEQQILRMLRATEP